MGKTPPVLKAYFRHPVRLRPPESLLAPSSQHPLKSPPSCERSWPRSCTRHQIGGPEFSRHRKTLLGRVNDLPEWKEWQQADVNVLAQATGYSSSSLCFHGTSGGRFTRPFGLGAAMHSSERWKTDVILTVVQHIPVRRGDLMTLSEPTYPRRGSGASSAWGHRPASTPCWVSAKS